MDAIRAQYSRVLIKRVCAEMIANVALRAFPREACGFLIGKVDGMSAHITEIVPTENISRAPDEFAISPDEHAVVARDVGPGLIILGTFHSHPGSFDPSNRDLRNMWSHRMLTIIVGGTAKGSPSTITLGAFRANTSRALMTIKAGIKQSWVRTLRLPLSVCP